MKTPSPELSHTTSTPSRPLLAVAVLILCCPLWGWSFPVVQFAIVPFENELRGSLPPTADLPISQRIGLSATFNAYRLALASALYALLTIRSQRRWSRHDLLGGFFVGLFFALGMIAQIVGLRYTSPSVSGFLTALMVVFTPLGQALLLRRPVPGKTWAAVALALAGTAILSWPSGATASAALPPPFPWFGEIMTLLGALFFTAQLLTLDHYSPNAHPARLTLMMFVTTAFLSALVALALGCHTMFTPAVAMRLAASPVVWWTLGSLVVLSTVIALHLMNTYQHRVSPAAASVIYCLEPIFALAFSLLFRAEILTLAAVLGGAVVLCAVLLVAQRPADRPTPA